MTLTLEQFNSLHKSCERIYAREKRAAARINMAAAQGTAKQMNKILEALEQIDEDGEGGDNDRTALRRRLGK